VNNELFLYMAYDRVGMVFNAPFAAINDACAIRMFKGNAKHPEIAVIADDLDLYKLGSLDPKTGEFKYADDSCKPVFLFRLAEEVNNG